MSGDDVQVELTPPEHITGMGKLLSMLSNYVGESDALLISSEEVQKRPITMRYFAHTFKLLHQKKDVKDCIGSLPSEERIDLFRHLLGRIDCFKSGMAKTGHKLSTSAAIAAEKPEEIDLSSY